MMAYFFQKDETVWPEKAAERAVKAIKKTAKVVTHTVKAIIEATKTLITAIAACGWIAILILVIVILFGGFSYDRGR